MKYLVGKSFKSHLGWHHAGELLPKEGETWQVLDSLIAASFVYPYVPEDGYDRLPPHVFSAVVTKQEALGYIAVGDAPIISDWAPPPILEASVALAVAEEESHAQNAEDAHKLARQIIDKREKAAMTPTDETLPKKPKRTDAKQAEAEAVAVVVVEEPVTS